MPLLLAAVALTGQAGSPARADDPSPSPAPPAVVELPVRISVSFLTRAPQPGLPFEVKGTITNTGSTPLSGVRVRLQVGEVLNTRSQLDQADTDRPRTFGRSGTTAELGAATTPGAAPPTALDLPAGGRVTFDLTTTTSKLLLGALGVYPLDVVAVARGGVHVGLTPTWLPWFRPDDHVKPTRVAVVWPLVDTPVATPRGPLLDDHLVASLSTGGRLATSLAAARAAEKEQCDPVLPGSVGKPTTCRPAQPVTYAVDPDLLDTVATMAGGYQVQPVDGKAVPGTGAKAAAAWLAQLRAAVAASPEQEVVALPYADPDVDALTHTPDGTVDVVDDQSLSRASLQALGLSSLDSVAVPPAGLVSRGAVDALAVGSTTTLVLDHTAYPEPSLDRQPQTSSAQTAVTTSTGQELDGLVTDQRLSDSLDDSQLATTLGPRLAEQRFLADTALLAAEAPSLSRTVVLSPARRGTVVAGAVAQELQDLGRVPWLCGVSLAAVADGAARCDGDADTAPTPTDRGGLIEPAGPPADQAALLRSIDKDRDDAEQITGSVLSSDTPAQEQSLRKAVARAQSSAFTGDVRGAQPLAGLLHQEAGQLLSTVDISAQNLTLTSDNGTLSVSVENTGSVLVQCRVRFSSPTLSIGFPKAQTSQTELLRIPGRTARQATVRAASATTGRYQVYAQLVDQEGRPFGRRMPILVRSTQYGRLALALTAGAGALLVAAAGLQIVRRVLRARRSA